MLRFVLFRICKGVGAGDAGTGESGWFRWCEHADIFGPEEWLTDDIVEKLRVVLNDPPDDFTELRRSPLLGERALLCAAHTHALARSLVGDVRWSRGEAKFPCNAAMAFHTLLFRRD